MRTRSSGAVLACALTLLLSACAGVERREPAPGRVHHVVICWLEDPAAPGARERIIEASRGFARLPGVIAVHAGTTLPGTREVVDSSFDVAVIMTFRDVAALQAYLAHPEHRKAAAEILAPLVKRMAVYDFIEH